MKVLFVYSLYEIQSTEKPISAWSSVQFGISYISSVLKQHGHETELVVLGSSDHDHSDMLTRSAVERFVPDIVCLTAVYSQYLFIRNTAAFIKSHWPDTFLLIGGVHATLNPDDVIHDCFDALCIGEGEYPVLELCGQLERKERPHGIANLWIKDPDGTIEKNHSRDFIQDLDSLPFPDREIWKPWVKEKGGSQFAVLLGRGCPYNCTYCSNHALRKVAPGKYTRVRSPENIIQELSAIYKEFPQAKKIYFEIETIAAKKEWAIELCSELERFNAAIGNSFSYGCNFRVSEKSVDEKLFSSFQKAHFYKINIGLESGSEKVRREVLKRNYSNQEFLDAVAMARKHGLAVYLYNMIGLPGESLSDHMETVALNRKCQPEGHSTGIFFPYPGTALYDLCIAQGFMADSRNSQVERKQALLNLPTFSKRQIQRAFIWFNYRVYKGHRPLLAVLSYVLTVKIKSSSTAKFLFRYIAKMPMLRNLSLIVQLKEQLNLFN